ncbi:TVP38/TMEM64 family protein [Paenibacillus sp. S150]|uniref:TVP38/TMEM64 family protein n=1 Tax=Paenibacillus sp. S150 TaxID=2749826 RepID=UPI001C56A82F|nr:TVP38/TMEM64 family protein [Paenibacillus sp. S150]MBW4080600.1 TVP38/TMEM64 family protein [Paenibacillus sp. S150]
MFKKIHFKNNVNVLSTAGLPGIIALCIYGYKAGLFTSFETLRTLMDQTGFWGPLVFILIQIIQVVLPILPGGISCAYGVLLFGAAYGFLYNYAGIVMGSVIAFLLSRQLGKPFIRKITPGRIYQKYIGWLDKSAWFEKLFALGIFLPGAPDDLLCMLAGVSGMKLHKFIIILILCKPGALFLYSTGLSGAISWITG